MWCISRLVGTPGHKLSANADFSIRDNFEFDPKITDGSDVQLEKRDSLMISILDLIKTVVDLPK
jgi:hypothetical protein